MKNIKIYSTNVGIMKKYSFILELSPKFYFWNITISRVGDYVLVLKIGNLI